MISPKISVIVPCYNEQKRLKEGFEHYYSFLKAQKYSWELIFVNDGSTDDTQNLMKKFAKGKKNIKTMSYKKNRGKGFAITQGVKIAYGQYILFTDLDHSVSISTINDFFNFFQKDFDVIIGSRRVKGAKFLKKQRPFREFLGVGFTALVRLFIDWKIKDATCGFKAFRGDVAKNIFRKITIYGWAFDAEVLYLCKKYQIKYFQAPVNWEDKSGSKVSLSKDIARSLGGLLKIRLNDLQGKYI